MDFSHFIHLESDSVNTFIHTISIQYDALIII